MLKYEEKFNDNGDIRWLPYLMYFHPTSHESDVVNTDALGFRITHGPEGCLQASAGGIVPDGPVRLMAGSSTVFGIGASGDHHTLPSYLWKEHAPSVPWLNFGGRSYNSVQELMLFLLYRHLVPHVEDIVLFSGFNTLGLSRLPASIRGDHGAFFNCMDFYGQMNLLNKRRRKGRRQPNSLPLPGDDLPPLDEQIEIAVDLTIRHLEIWRLLCEGIGAKLTYVLQPLATWVRDEPATQEKQLFAELDAISDFSATYGDIASMDTHDRYSAVLSSECNRIGVRYLDISPVIADAIGKDDWIFVDRIHFTDSGHDLVAKLLAESLSLT